jgi:hypothetical protein
MSATDANPVSRLRRSLGAARLRALLVALAVAVFGGQLALQSHLAGHDLAAIDGPCVYALHVQHLTPLPAAPTPVPGDATRHAAPESAPSVFPLDRAPLVERSRGPPSLLA